ncbi:hypothetical protein SKAU_G00054030 [Synaphobranchus kaupii]|uniref:Uncharacterized protein n=1 Tax=Synaphobranchus kaupii TaxID=118154 RepID=A0A9Q1J9Q4_SYNKA|nr:hypothetical protein SKAU_G00054030 [Synaphobranchus kaupii]
MCGGAGAFSPFSCKTTFELHRLLQPREGKPDLLPRLSAFPVVLAEWRPLRTARNGVATRALWSPRAKVPRERSLELVAEPPDGARQRPQDRGESEAYRTNAGVPRTRPSRRSGVLHLRMRCGCRNASWAIGAGLNDCRCLRPRRSQVTLSRLLPFKMRARESDVSTPHGVDHAGAGGGRLHFTASPALSVSVSLQIPIARSSEDKHAASLSGHGAGRESLSSKALLTWEIIVRGKKKE